MGQPLDQDLREFREKVEDLLHDLVENPKQRTAFLLRGSEILAALAYWKKHKKEDSLPQTSLYKNEEKGDFPADLFRVNWTPQDASRHTAGLAELGLIEKVPNESGRGVTQIALATDRAVQSSAAEHREVRDAYRDLQAAYKDYIEGESGGDQQSDHGLEDSLVEDFVNAATDCGFRVLRSINDLDQDPPVPEYRLGLTLAQVNAGYAVPRERVLPDGDRERVTSWIATKFDGGESCIVLGAPGSGKSIILKQVACEWLQSQRGPVLYHRGDVFDPIQRPRLQSALRKSGGSEEVLIVVEDVLNGKSRELLKLVKASSESSVSLLFEAISGDWKASLARMREEFTGIRDRLSEIDAPGLDIEECDRILEHIAENAGVYIPFSANEIFDDLKSNRAGQISLLFHRLPPTRGSGGDTFLPSSLEAQARSAMEALHPSEELEPGDLNMTISNKDPEVFRAALAIQFANVLGLPLRENELMEAFGEATDGTMKEMDTALEKLKIAGVIAENQGNEEPSLRADHLQSYHGVWSSEFLSQVAKRGGKPPDVQSVKAALTALAHYHSELHEDVTGRIRTQGDSGTTGVEEGLDPWDDFVDRLSQAGRRRPSLAPLLGDIEIEALGIDPEMLRTDTRIMAKVWKSRMLEHRRDFQGALDVVREAEVLTGGQADFLFGRVHRMQGSIYYKWAKSGAGEEKMWESIQCYQEALEYSPQNGDPQEIALTLYDLATDWRQLGEISKAWDKIEEALPIVEGSGTTAEALVLHERAQIFRQIGCTRLAEEELEEARAICETEGIENVAPWCYDTLGLIHLDRGEGDQALDRFNVAAQRAAESGHEDAEAWISNDLARAYILNREPGDAKNYIKRDEDLGEYSEESVRTDLQEARIHLLYAAKEAEKDTVNSGRPPSEEALDTAEEQLWHGIARCQELGDPKIEARLWLEIARLHELKGKSPLAAYAQAEGLGSDIYHARIQADARFGQGRHYLSQERCDLAVALLMDAQGLYEQIGFTSRVQDIDNLLSRSREGEC